MRRLKRTAAWCLNHYMMQFIRQTRSYGIFNTTCLVKFINFSKNYYSDRQTAICIPCKPDTTNSNILKSKPVHLCTCWQFYIYYSCNYLICKPVTWEWVCRVAVTHGCGHCSLLVTLHPGAAVRDLCPSWWIEYVTATKGNGYSGSCLTRARRY